MHNIRFRLNNLFTKKEKKRLVFLSLAALVMGFLEVAGVASIGPFMAVVASPELIEENIYLHRVYQFFNFSSQGKFLTVLGALVLVTLTVSNAFSAIMNGWTIHFSNMQGHHLSMHLMKKYMSQPYVFYLNRNTADLSKNILSEVYRCVGGVILPAIQTVSKAIVTLFIFGFLLFLDPFIALTVVIVLGTAYGFVLKIVRHHVNEVGKLSTVAVLERYKLANEALSGIKDLKLAGRELEFLNRFESQSERSAKYSAHAGLIATMPRYALETVAFGGIVAIVIYLLNLGRGGGHIIPLISLYALAGYRLMPALQQIYAGITRIKFNLPALDIIVKDLHETASENELKKRDVNPLRFDKKIVLENIRFTYPNSDKPVVKGINLTINVNSTIGLIGTTGSGKTTLVDIILGLLCPDKGTITIDDDTINSKNIARWQRNVGYVPQAIYLTDDTIARNIAFAVPDTEIDMDSVTAAAKMANLDGFINSLNDKYDTIIGERGVRLSGGQRQRIGIARALYNNPKVLVLDEATSALDGITENVIMEAIHNLSHKKTIIMIAHRLTTIKECDAIYLLEKGAIVDGGTYEELLKKNRHFYNMANA